ncbi:PLP-dependent aminotransferase family protein [Bacillus velezensis]|uniref:MocR-like pyridoxine biosynthesis transcription factor PdxR n=1 Tax=Bacillus TaxID=1386 RepID=UPI0011B64CA0|nr:MULTISPECIES: PLP-dependent aminotransferase family protein [Bacillus amyloliquefaciens group]MEC3630542.1 PLP-dependent aminotransferase family protein [Bacillus velezensis]QGJ63802.1 PLP-dependent aminotransferase family protein [Bacillus velezensis]
MKNMIFAFRSGTPKYKQIYEQFKTLIEQGNIQADERLPSIRELADSLRVSRNTTLMAYDLLLAEGYIRGETRKGYFANEVEPSLFQKENDVVYAEETESAQPVLIDFRAGAVDQKHFPLKTWRKLYNQVLTSEKSFLYGEPFGERDLREQIAAYLLESRGVKTDADSIIIGSSTQQMLIYLSRILKEDFSGIIVEDPGFDGARAAFQFHGLSMETMPVYENGADFSQLHAMKEKLIYVTPSHHSPYGVSMSIQQRQTLINWVNHREGYILEDDYDSEFRYTQQPFPALASIQSDRVIYLGNFSKSFLPGIRISYMVLPQRLLHRYKKRFIHFESTASSLNQLTMAELMKAGEWTRHIKRMRTVYKRKMQHLTSHIKQQFGDQVTIIGEQSGLYILVRVHLNYTEETLIERAFQYGVKVYPTAVYFVAGKPEPPIIKLGFAHLDTDQITQGVQLLRKAWLS